MTHLHREEAERLTISNTARKMFYNTAKNKERFEQQSKSGSGNCWFAHDPSKFLYAQLCKIRVVSLLIHIKG